MKSTLTRAISLCIWLFGLFAFGSQVLLASANPTEEFTINEAPPTAFFTTNLTSGPAPLQVSFNAISSSDSDGTVESYAWDFDDGTTGSGVFESHTFNDVGTYDVSLVVTDNDGEQSAPFVVTITVTAAQNPPVLDPIGNLSVIEGETRVVTITAFDADVADVLSFSVNGNLPAFATLVDNGDRSATLTLAPAIGAAGIYSGVTFFVSDGSTTAEETISIIVENEPEPCTPLSTLLCDDIDVALPFSLAFSGTEGGIIAGNGLETGFTMVDPPSFNLFPAVPSNSDVPGLEAGLLDVSNGQLTITSTRGIQIESPSGSTNNNSQVNALGVGFTAPGSVFNVEAQMNQPDFSVSLTNADQQGGIWFGLDEDNYAKLVIIKVSGNSNRAQLLVERTDPENSSQVIIESIRTGGFPNTANTIDLRMEVDPVFNVLRGYYSIDGGSEVLIEENQVSTVSLPESFTDGVNHDNEVATAPLSYAGVFCTHRRATEGSPIDFSFNDFGVDVPPVVPSLLFSTGVLNINHVQGTTPVNNTVSLFTNNGTAPGIILSDDPHAGNWLDFPSNPSVGEIILKAKTGLAEGSYNTTIFGIADGYVNAELVVNLVVSSPNSAPRITGTIPADGATDVSLNTSISANELFIPNDLNGVFGVANNSITNQTVKLFKVSTNTEIPATVNGTGGGDAINLTPSIPLEINTIYRFEVNGVTDLTGVTFEPFTSTFTTAADNTGSGSALDEVSFTNAGNVATNGSYTSLTIGPDGKLYALDISGTVDRWTIEPDGSLSGKETITTLFDAYGARAAVGLAFAPTASAANLIAYVSHAEGVLNGGQPWDGKISRLSGANLEVEDLIVTNLPRSRRDHLTNSITFRPGEPSVLYFNQGSNSAGGAPDNSWGNRKERLLSAATLRLDLDRLPEAAWPLDAKTTMDQSAINNVDINSPTLGSGMGTFDESDGTFPDDGTYNPFFVNAPLTIFASGIRNAYDLVWHSNGQLYVPNNGTAGGSNSPESVDGTRRIDGTIYDYSDPSNDYPPVPSTSGNNTQRDFLFRIDPSTSTGYYGHPNPLRGEFILNRGPVDVNNYPNSVGTDVNFRGVAFDFEFNKSPNGVIEYRSNAEGGNLQGALLVCRYSGGSDIIALVPNGPNGDILTTKIGIPGFTGFQDPLDITEDVTTGNLYVSDLAQQTIVLLKPSDQALPEPIISLNPISIVIDEVIGGAASDPITVFVSNTGNATLNNPMASLSGPDASDFILDASSLPATLAPNSTTSVLVYFNPLVEGPKTATITVSGDNAASSATLDLQGLGKDGTGGSNEPSLQYIFDTYELPINVADQDPTSNQIDLAGGATYNDFLGDEVVGKLFQRAVPSPVTVEVLGVFGPEANNPIVSFGWYPLGESSNKQQLFTIDNTISGNGQTLNPVIAGVTSFDPGSTIFGWYSQWPFFGNRAVYSEDNLNIFSGSIPHHVRVYEIPGEDNAYAIAFEEHTSGFDYQDLVLIVRNIEVVEVTLGPAITATPFESLFETSVRPDAPHQDTSLITISNTGNADLVITSVTLAGDFVSDYSFSGPTAITLAPAASQEYEVIFAPTLNGDDRGYKEGALVFECNTLAGVFNYGLHGLKKNGLGGNHEPALQDVVNTLGVNIDVGWTTLPSDTDPMLKGEEVNISLFEAVGTEPIGLVPVARYSPQEVLPYGWYTNDEGTITTFEVASLQDGKPEGQTLYPPLLNGSLEFDAQGAFFGLYTQSNFFGRTNYTEDQLNTGGVEHRTRVYPARNRAGELVPNTYLICFEDAANGDYNDYVFLLSNVRPYVPASPSLSFSPEGLPLFAAANETSEVGSSTLSANFFLDESQISLSASEDWINLPTTIGLDTPLDFSADATGLAFGVYFGEVIASAPGFVPDTLQITLTVSDAEPGTVRVNFQDDSFNPPIGYLADQGDEYGLRLGGFRYGWINPTTGLPQSNFDGARGDERGVTNESTDTDKLLRSFNHLDRLNQNEARDWEIEMPNGLYSVKLAAGDPSATNSQHTLRAEGVVIIDNFVPSQASFFRVGVDTVRISDGKLTIDDVGAPADGNSKLIYLEAVPVDSSLFAPVVAASYSGNQSPTGEYYGQVTVTLSAEDQSGSGGIAAIRYRVNGGDFIVYTGPFQLTATSGPADYFLELDATDNFGNVGSGTTNVEVVPATGAILRLENMTKVPNTNRGFPADDTYAFNWILGPFNARGDTATVHDENVMRVHNDGVGPLIITELTTTNTDDFIVVSPSVPPNGLLVNPGEFLDVTLGIVSVGGDRRVITEHLVLMSNADNAAEVDATLIGGIATRPEGNNELTNQQIFEVFGFTTEMGKDGNGEYIVRPASNIPTDEEINNGSEGDMILSGYFVQADPNQPIRLFKLAAMHGPGGAVAQLTNALDQRPGNVRYNHAGEDYNSILAKTGNTATTIAGDFTSNINEPFRVTVAGYRTSGGNRNGQLEDQILGARVYKVKDRFGNVVPNEYIIIQDYIGNGCGSGSGNCDWNDNVEYLINARPVGEPSTTGIGDIAIEILNPESYDISAFFDRGYPGNRLTYTATITGGGSLPDWVILDPDTGVFSIQAPFEVAGQSFDISVIATDYNLLQVNADFTINVLDTDIDCTVEANQDGLPKQIDCNNPSVQLSGFTSTGIYIWNGPNGFSSSAQNPVVTEAGTYTLTTQSSGPTTCPLSSEIEVIQGQEAPVLSIIAPDRTLTCSIGELDLTAASNDPSVTYSWFDPNNQLIGTNPTVTVATTGEFRIVITNAAGCTDSELITIDEDLTPQQAGNDGSLTVCGADAPFDLFNELVSFGGSPAPGGTWTLNGEVISATLDPATASSGIYTYTVGGILGCSTDMAALDITVEQPTLYYSDIDFDGLGDAAESILACSPPVGYVTNGDDNCPTVNSTDLTDTDNDGEGDVCDDDDDGDGVPDLMDCDPLNALIGAATVYYEDADGDGFGDPASSQISCTGAPSGYVLDNTDNCPATFNPSQNDADNDGLGDACDDSVFGRTSIWLEAECGEVGGNWDIRNDAAASHGEYVVALSSSTANPPADLPENYVRFLVEDVQAGTFYLYARILAENSGEDSFWVRVNGGEWVRWWQGIAIGANFNWNEVIDSPVALSDGLNTVDFAFRETGGKIDKLHLDVNPGLPVGIGEVAQNCDDITNAAPVAMADASPSTGPGPLSVTLDGSNSTDADGFIVDYAWTWPQGSANGQSVQVAFPVGTYNVTLTVTDEDGATGTDIIAINSLDPLADTDEDGILDSEDICPTVFNPEQILPFYYLDTDGDGFGDPNFFVQECEPPVGYVDNDLDNCPDLNSSNVLDFDNDGIGDICDPDDDNDGVLDGDDCDPFDDQILDSIVYYEDADGDGFGDPNSTLETCDPPVGYVLNGTDNCPDTPNPDQLDADGDGIGNACDASVAGRTEFWLEAECAEVGANWETVSSAAASNGEYVNYPLGNSYNSAPTSADDRIRFVVDNVQAGSFHLFANVLADGSANNSFWVRVNEGNWIRWWEGINISGNFAWNEVLDSPFDLVDGTNTIDFAYREDGTILDKIHLDQNGAIPTGLGEDADNCSTTENLPPTAVAEATPISGEEPLMVTLDGSNSTDSDGLIVSYDWAWNGGSFTGISPSIEFFAGTYDITLTVTDDDDATSTDIVTITVSTSTTDTDNDGIRDALDNCPTVPNPDQSLFVFYRDADNDGFGDPAESIEACEAPAGYVANADDNCPTVSSSDLTDTDNDGEGNPCDEDDDGDGVLDVDDCYPLDNTRSAGIIYYADFDADGFGDPNSPLEACSPPANYVSDNTDNCPDTNNPDQEDLDNDGIGDACDDALLGVNIFWLEAECAEVGANWEVRSDVTASGGNYAVYLGDRSTGAAPADVPENYVRFILGTARAGSYHLFARVQASNTGADSYWGRINGGPWVRWGNNFVIGSDFAWNEIGDGQMNLVDGLNTIDFAYREPNTQLDKIYLSLDGIMPTGEGDFAANCGNQPPIAHAAASPTVGPAPLLVELDGRASFDIDGTIASYQWDWNGGSATGDNPEVTFTDPGNYMVTMTVTDDEGATSTDQIAISVTEPLNQAPQAVATATPSSGVSPLTVTLDATTSSDADGTIVGYTWSWPGGNASGATTQEVFTTGVYAVTLTVTDDEGATGTAEIQVEAFEDQVDTDNDGVFDADDNCPTVFNPDQSLTTFYADTDGDGLGDPNNSIEDCEAPTGYVADATDNCPDVSSSDITDSDNDGMGDVCDDDDDNDGVLDTEDCDPLDPLVGAIQTYYADTDNDGFGDPANSTEACSQPAGYVLDNTDNCPDTANPDQLDDDNDGFGNACDNLSGGRDFFWLEAECAQVGTGWSTLTDANASNGSYVVYSSGNSTSNPPADLPENYVRFAMDDVLPGDYYLYGRVLANNSGDDSFWVRINGGEWFRWWQGIQADGNFNWNEVTNSPFPLPEGANTIDFAYREDGARLDKLHLTVTSGLPTDLGPQGANCDGQVNQPPTAIAAADPVSGFAPLEVQFDGTASSDSDGSIISYEWTWATGAASGATPALVTFVDAGTYDVTLTVTDDLGLTATDAVTITVNEAPNVPPTAVAMATPTSGDAPLSVQLDGSGSSDSDGNITSYAWDWGSGSTTGVSPQVIFPLGSYVVTLTVTDDDGATATDFITIDAFDAAVDTDNDGVLDGDDNCPTVPNPDQSLSTFYADTDGDGFGDPNTMIEACFAPAGYVSDNSDNCPDVNDADLTDTDNDGEGDACDPDDDDDGVLDVDDCDPLDDQVGAAQVYYADTDNDGFGDPNDPITACDQPAGYVLDNTDNCPQDSNPDQEDTDGDGLGDVCDTAPSSSFDFWLEAECATVGSGWQTFDDGSASSGEYVVFVGDRNTGVPTTDDPDQQVNFTVDITDAGVYTLYCLMNAPDPASNSLWVRVDQGNWIKFWKDLSGAQIMTSGFEWVEVNDDGGDVSFSLTPGTHMITIANREPGTGVDKIFLSVSEGLPVGQGESATNCGMSSAVVTTSSSPEMTTTTEDISRVSPNEEGRQENVAADKGRSFAPSMPPSINEGANLLLFPNPTRESLSLRLNSSYAGKLTTIIMDANGRRVAHYRFEKASGAFEERLDVDRLPSGTYTLRIVQGDEQFVRKFVKMP